MDKVIIDYGGIPRIYMELEDMPEEVNDLMTGRGFLKKSNNPYQPKLTSLPESLIEKTLKTFYDVKRIMKDKNVEVDYFIPRTEEGIESGITNISISAKKLSFEKPNWMRHMAKEAGEGLTFSIDDDLNGCTLNIFITDEEEPLADDEQVNLSNSCCYVKDCASELKKAIFSENGTMGSDWVMNFERFSNLMRACEILNETIYIDGALMFIAEMDDETKKFTLSIVVRDGLILYDTRDRFYDLLDTIEKLDVECAEYNGCRECLKISLVFPGVWDKSNT